jgi:hypothetical protein
MRRNIFMKQNANKDAADLIGVVLCGGQSSRMGAVIGSSLFLIPIFQFLKEERPGGVIEVDLL